MFVKKIVDRKSYWNDSYQKYDADGLCWPRIGFRQDVLNAIMDH